MHRPHRQLRFQAGQRGLGLAICAASLASVACSDEPPWKARSERALAQARAEDAEEERIEAEEQLERDLAIAAIENDRGEPPRPLDERELEGVFAYYCGDCHDGRIAPEETAVFVTADDLFQVGRIIPGNAEMSRVMIRIRAGEMPPDVPGAHPLPPATIELIADFIDNYEPTEP